MHDFAKKNPDMAWHATTNMTSQVQLCDLNVAQFFLNLDVSHVTGKKPVLYLKAAAVLTADPAVHSADS